MRGYPEPLLNTIFVTSALAVEMPGCLDLNLFHSKQVMLLSTGTWEIINNLQIFLKKGLFSSYFQRWYMTQNRQPVCASRLNHSTNDALKQLCINPTCVQTIKPLWATILCYWENQTKCRHSQMSTAKPELVPHNLCRMLFLLLILAAVFIKCPL